MDERGEKVLRTINRLLALANSANEHEATVAANKAARLIAEYNVEEWRLNGDAPAKVVIGVVYEGSTRSEWRAILGVGVADASFCFFYTHNGRKSPETIARLGPRYNGTRWVEYKMIGREANVESATYMFSYLQDTIMRLGNEAMLNEKTDRAGLSARSWADSWRKGCATRLRDRLQETVASEIQESSETGIVPLSMVLARQSEAESHVKSLGIVISYPKSRWYYLEDAFDKGVAAADAIHIGRSLTHDDRQLARI